jgi:hypothetical protein
MKINQLFKDKVPEDVAIRLLSCFGLKGFDDTAMFCKDDLVKISTTENTKKMCEDLRLYYLPCKAKIYLALKDEQCCITLLRQVLRLFDKTLISIQKYANHKKITYYQLNDYANTKKQVKLTSEQVRVDFS